MKTASRTAPARERIEANPGDLVLGANVRSDGAPSKDLVASVRERGVLVPIVAYRDDDGGLVVLHGRRRTLAAVQAKRATVPVHVVPEPTEADRVVDQLTENEHRAGLTIRDRVGAYEQLAALGISAAQIAKRVAAPKAQVTAALAVAGSQVALEATKRAELTLDQAAVIAEFDDDPLAVERLIGRVEDGGSMDHLVARLRDERIEAARLAEAAVPYLEAGLTVIERPDYSSTTRELDRLGVAEQDHRDCVGHALFIEGHWSDEDADEEDPAADKVYEPVYVCTNPGVHVTAGAPAKNGTTDDAKLGAEKAARRDVIESNKAWDTATGVRRAWLKTFLTRKAAPKAAPFIALALARAEYGVTSAISQGHQLAHELLGIESSGYGTARSAALVDGALAGASDARALVVALALVLAAYEESASRNSWRVVDRGTTEYLRFIEAMGYELADVERRACGEEVTDGE